MKRNMTFASIPLAMLMLGATALAAHQQPPTKEERGKQIAPAGETVLHGKIRDELGDQWTVEKKGTALLARRNVTQPPSETLKQRVDDQIRALQKVEKNLNTTLSGDEVRLRGTAATCDDLTKSVGDFARIEGVNHIRIDATCGSK